MHNHRNQLHNHKNKNMKPSEAFLLISQIIDVAVKHINIIIMPQRDTRFI